MREAGSGREEPGGLGSAALSFHPVPQALEHELPRVTFDMGAHRALQMNRLGASPPS